jgi:hypothetical protein
VAASFLSLSLSLSPSPSPSPSLSLSFTSLSVSHSHSHSRSHCLSPYSIVWRVDTVLALPQTLVSYGPVASGGFTLSITPSWALAFTVHGAGGGTLMTPKVSTSVVPVPG